MSRADRLRLEAVEFIPERLGPGILYVSRRYATASHLCCCGCGLEVVTPLNSAKWRLTETDDGPSLRPSVGNWSFACRSHYWIEGGRVRWTNAMSPRMVAKLRAGDRLAAELLAGMHLGFFGRQRRRLVSVWRTIRGWLKA